MSSVTVGLVVPTKNASRTLQACLESIVRQSARAGPVVVDCGPSMMRRLSHPTVRIICSIWDRPPRLNLNEMWQAGMGEAIVSAVDRGHATSKQVIEVLRR